MSAAAGGAVGEAHRVGGDVADTIGLLSRSNSMDSTEGSRRRSLRKREGKSYAEFGEADFIIDEDGSVPGSPVKGHHQLASNVVSNSISATATLSNGDVEMESEDDEDTGPLEPLPLPKELPMDVLEERKALIRKLQTQLRNEEMSLVLLKKIRQSQVLAEQAKEAAAKVSIQPAASNHRQSQSSHRGTPPSVGTVQGKSRHGLGASGITSSASSGARSGGHKSVLTPDLSHLQPVSVDPKNLPPGLPANLVSLMSKGALGATKLTEVSKTPKMDTETPAQKQAAAKLQLRKQLEKTLLQIPPPKPPPPEMHFIPNPANTEFICLLGLEECVSKILNEDKENSIQPVPFSCSQCGTDFTPTWKWDKGARGKEVKVICENCVTTNVKKALKAEHTNRLKAAFVKALQQEQELEASMAAGASGTTTTSSAARISSPSGRNSVDVTVRASSSSRSIPSAHQQSRTSSAATVERATYRSSGNLAGRSTAAQLTRTNSSSGSRTNSYNGGSASGSGRSASNKTSSDSLANANAMAAQVAALMGMGAYGSDPTAATSMALLQAAAAQQQLLMGSGYGSGSSTNSSSSRTNNGSGGGSQRSGNSSNDLNSQFAAMNQLMNPLMYNYQAMAAMAQAMAAMSGSSGSGSKNSGSSSSSSSATNQMLEIQRQAAEQLQRQYLLDMIPPGSLSGSWSGSGKK